jgi:hypothetical protein
MFNPTFWMGKALFGPKPYLALVRGKIARFGGITIGYAHQLAAPTAISR